MTRQGWLWLAALAFILSGCGSAALGPQSATGDPQLSAELAALAPGGELREADWQQLSNRLQELVAQRQTSAAKSLEAAQFTVTDFSISAQTESTITLEWTYRNPGDYDQNGEVNASDLVFLARNFHVKIGDPGWDLAKVADSNNSGDIEIGDVTAIGMNYRNAVSGYYIMPEWGDNDHNGVINIADLTLWGRLRVEFPNPNEFISDLGFGPYVYPFDPDHEVNNFESNGEALPGPWFPLISALVAEGSQPQAGGWKRFGSQMGVIADHDHFYSIEGRRLAIFPFYQGAPQTGSLRFGRRGDFLRIPTLSP